MLKGGGQSRETLDFVWGTAGVSLAARCSGSLEELVRLCEVLVVVAVGSSRRGAAAEEGAAFSVASLSWLFVHRASIPHACIDVMSWRNENKARGVA